jgi:hypothetical protein
MADQSTTPQSLLNAHDVEPPRCQMAPRVSSLLISRRQCPKAAAQLEEHFPLDHKIALNHLPAIAEIIILSERNPRTFLRAAETNFGNSSWSDSAKAIIFGSTVGILTHHSKTE